MNYLEKLNKKCNVGDKFIAIVNSMFDKLVDFGYISPRQITRLSKKLYENIDTFFSGDQIPFDYKSGYYDSVKKELYIKDLDNIESVYQRLMYVLTTTEISKDNFSVGYSTATLSTSNYKIIHKNFGINRAIVSNLVCRLLYTIPDTLSIVPTYRSYYIDFLGSEIKSDNDIYSIEGKLLKQICYTYNAPEEELYNNIFTSNPQKFLKRYFKKYKMDESKKIIDKLDEVSRLYSNYNKLCFLNNKLDENYINIKKNILENDVEDFIKEEKKIKLAITNAISKLSDNIDENEDEDFNIENSLSEKINELEEKVLNSIADLQSILINEVIKEEENYSPILFAIKLKQLSSILIIQNKKIKEKLFETITFKLLNKVENHSSNLIEKIRYSLVNDIISNDKYIKIYKNMMFNKLESMKLKNGTNLVALKVDNEFIKLVEVNDLNLTTKKLDNNINKLMLDNLGYLLNNPSARSSIYDIEKLFTDIKTSFKEYNNVSINDIFICEYNEYILSVLKLKDGFNILKINYEQNDIKIKKVKLSDEYSLFNFNTNLPTVYNENTNNPLRRILALFFNLI